jgi:hypothetical protein
MARYQKPGRLEVKPQWSKRRGPIEAVSLELKIRKDTTNSFTTSRSQDGKEEKEDEDVN